MTLNWNNFGKFKFEMVLGDLRGPSGALGYEKKMEAKNLTTQFP
jgi:hypothetical protein